MNNRSGQQKTATRISTQWLHPIHYSANLICKPLLLAINWPWISSRRGTCAQGNVWWKMEKMPRHLFAGVEAISHSPRMASSTWKWSTLETRYRWFKLNMPERVASNTQQINPVNIPSHYVWYVFSLFFFIVWERWQPAAACLCLSKTDTQSFFLLDLLKVSVAETFGSPLGCNKTHFFKNKSTHSNM